MEQALAPRSRCRYCGEWVRIQPATVRRFNHIAQTHHREANPLAGRYDRGGAVRMGYLDPSGYFCKMECAVRYAVRAVEGQP